MERAVASLKWKTTASAACSPRRDSTSPYSMADTVFPTASRIVCSLFSGLGGPIILGCSPLLACWLSIRAPSALADDLYLPTPRISYPCLAVSLTSWDILAPVERIHRRFIAPRYRRGCPAATPRGLQGESCSTTAGFVKRS